jgi:DNA modification methylase
VRGKDNVKGLPIDRAFDAEFANALARYETYNKHLYRPNTYLHKWWARRCGTTFRLLLKHLVEEEGKRDYYTPGGLEGKVILDPMMGGGTTLHEAIRMGANVIGADIDPIPILQARATLADVPLSDLEAAFDSFFEQLQADIGPYFTTACPDCDRPSTRRTQWRATLRFMLYGLQRFCDCGPALFVDSFILRWESDGTVISLCPNCHQVTSDVTGCHCSPDSDKRPLQLKRTKSCPDCNQPFRDDFETPFYSRYVPLVRVGRCPKHKMFFDSPATADLENITAADMLRSTLPNDPALAIHLGPKSGHLLRRGIASYADLFSSRQLLYLNRAIELLQDLDPLIRLNFSLLVSTSLEFNSMLCGYKGSAVRRSGAIRHAFSHHAYYFPYMALENNPLNPRKSSGTLKKLFHSRLRRARKWAEKPVERKLGMNGTKRAVIPGEVDYGREVETPEEFQDGQRRFWLRQGSSAELPLPDNSVDYIVTDPPYFDSVQYSDLATFFRVWLEKMLPDGSQPGIHWSYDLNGSAVAVYRSDNGQYDKDRPYDHVIGQIFGECYRVLRKANGRLIFTYHHWNPQSWAAITAALKRSNFILVNRYVVHSENPISVHIAGFRALTDDTILVLAPKEADVDVTWERPPQINTTQSAAFCHDCGTLLGWLLAGDAGEDEIYGLWKEMLSAVERP